MYGILRIKKYKMSNVGGIENHIERKRTTTNPDIQQDKTKLNYDITGQQHRTLKSLIKDVLNKYKINKIRKNGVAMTEFLFTASTQFFENMIPQEIHSYFENCYEFVCKKYGKENVIAADVHLDEKTPHMHLELVPIHKEKLDARSLFNNKLDQLQEEVHQEVFSKYGLERGDSHRKAKHVSSLNYKIITLEKEKEDLEKQIAELQNTRDNNTLYKLNNDLKKTQEMLSDMFKVLEHNPKLMREYKEAIQEMKRREQEEKEIEM